MKVGDRIEIQIDRLSYDGGRGVGRLNDFVFFVAGTSPDELVEADIVELKKNFGVAKLRRLVRAGPSRRKAPCPVYDSCGGCVWQHISYPEQITQKQNQLAFALKKVLPPEMANPKIISSPNEFRYRNRVQLHVSGEKIGFFAAGTNDLVEINDCLIADERLFKGLNWRAPEFKSGRKVEIALDNAGRRVLRNLSEEESVFSQVNTEQNEILKRTVVDWARSTTPPKSIYDLYCGDGNLSFALLAELPVERFTGVEFSSAAVARAKAKNQYGLGVQFRAQDVQAFLAKTRILDPETLIVADPPRAGLGSQVCADLLRLRPDHIIYVSCNLSTLARDLTALTADYKVAALVGLDMFPQTEYIEAVVSLVPRASR